jgi:hypothetical protein
MDSAGSPLAKKLKLQPGMRAAVIGAPAGYVDRLAGHEDVLFSDRLDGRFDWIQVFARTSAELAAVVAALTAAIEPDGRIWISYPKASSKLQSDLTRDKGWQPLDGGDLMWLSLVSVDETWSAFGLRPYKPGEARQTFR